MKTMKILSVLAVLFGFTQCASMKLQKKAPFKIASATYNHWVGGLPGVSGTKAEIRLSEKSNITFESLYFLNKIIKVETKEEKGRTLLIANHTNTSTNKRDVILSSDSKKEMKNQLPDTKEFPFELKENEAIISYKVKDKLKYFKITNLKKVQSDFYPEMRK